MAISPKASPLMLLLGAMVLLLPGVCAVGAVLGVDLGTEYIKAALVKPGIPLDIVLTKDSRRKETSAVALKPLQAEPKAGSFPERFYGSDAMALAPRFPAEVYPNLKTLLGLPVDDSVVQEYASRHPALQLQAHETRGTSAFKSSTFPSGEDAWMVEELLAMELQSIQKNAESAAGKDASVRSIVLTVPPFYTTEEKRAVQTAAELAGLKVLALISDGLAVGLNYATSRQFPNINEGAEPEYHLVFDMGAGSTTATVMRFQGRTVKDVGKFNRTFQEVQAIGSGWDRSLGGDAFNYLIMDDMVAQFIASPGAAASSITPEAVKAHGRAMAKLAKEAERVRHVLSANQATHASIEGLYEDIDFKYKLTRSDFEAMAAAHVERVDKVIKDAVEMSAIQIGSLTSIILHGGATRTPLVQKALEKAVGSSEKIRSNVNADEAAVFGAGFRAAELSPSFRVKEIRVSEGPMYEAGLKRTTSNGKQIRQRLWTATSPMGGPAKEMTFAEQDDFSITFYQQVGSDDRDIKKLATKNLTATVAAMKDRYPTCEEKDLSFKLAFELSSVDGEVEVAKAAVECKAEVPEKEGFVGGVKNLFGFGKKEQQPLKDLDEKNSKTAEGSEETLKDGAKSSTATPSASSSTESSSSDATKPSAQSDAEKKIADADADAKPVVKKKETVSIPVQVVLENAGLPTLTKAELAKAKNRLKSFASSDKARVLKEEAFNQLEAFTYKVRDLLEGEAFVSRSTKEERAKLSEKASEVSEWLYEGGAKATKEELKAKLKALQGLVAPVQTRIDEAEKRPELVSALKTLLNQTSQFVSGLREQIFEFEKWQSSSSASAGGSSATSSAPKESPSGEFDGLEDQDGTSTTGGKADKAAETPEPVQPLYKKEEVDGIEALYRSTSKWLSELEARQEGLPLTANPVLLSKDLTDKQQKLEKASMELAVKGMKNFKSQAKKASKSASKKRTKTKSADEAGKTIKVEDGKLTDEKLAQMMDEIKKMEEAKKMKDEGKKKGDGGDKKAADEKKHDEL